MTMNIKQKILSVIGSLSILSSGVIIHYEGTHPRITVAEQSNLKQRIAILRDYQHGLSLDGETRGEYGIVRAHGNLVVMYPNNCDHPIGYDPQKNRLDGMDRGQAIQSVNEQLNQLENKLNISRV